MADAQLGAQSRALPCTSSRTGRTPIYATGDLSTFPLLSGIITLLPLVLHPSAKNRHMKQPNSHVLLTLPPSLSTLHDPVGGRETLVVAKLYSNSLEMGKIWVC